MKYHQQLILKISLLHLQIPYRNSTHVKIPSNYLFLFPVNNTFAGCAGPLEVKSQKYFSGWTIICTIVKRRKIRSILQAINFTFFFSLSLSPFIANFSRRVANHCAHIFHRSLVSRNQDKISCVIPSGQWLSQDIRSESGSDLSWIALRVYACIVCVCAYVHVVARRAYLLDILALALSVSRCPSDPCPRRITRI